MKFQHLRLLVVFFLVCGFSTLGRAKAGDSNNVMFSLPIVSVLGEAVLRGEMSLPKKGGLGLEVIRVEFDEFSEKEKEERNGDALLVLGAELALYYISYSNSKQMSGGYWSFGAGYRQLQTDWVKAELSLTEAKEVKHSLRSKGVTVRGRVGYRYVGTTIPISVGVYLGLRHFANKFTDPENSDDTSTDIPIDNAEIISLERRFTSSLEPGIEFGMAF